MADDVEWKLIEVNDHLLCNLLLPWSTTKTPAANAQDMKNAGAAECSLKR